MNAAVGPSTAVTPIAFPSLGALTAVTTAPTAQAAALPSLATVWSALQPMQDEGEMVSQLNLSMDLGKVIDVEE